MSFPKVLNFVSFVSLYVAQPKPEEGVAEESERPTISTIFEAGNPREASWIRTYTSGKPVFRASGEKNTSLHCFTERKQEGVKAYWL